MLARPRQPLGTDDLPSAPQALSVEKVDGISKMRGNERQAVLRKIAAFRKRQKQVLRFIGDDSTQSQAVAH